MHYLFVLLNCPNTKKFTTIYSFYTFTASECIRSDTARGRLHTYMMHTHPHTPAHDIIYKDYKVYHEIMAVKSVSMCLRRFSSEYDTYLLIYVFVPSYPKSYEDDDFQRDV